MQGFLGFSFGFKAAGIIIFNLAEIKVNCTAHVATCNTIRAGSIDLVGCDEKC